VKVERNNRDCGALDLTIKDAKEFIEDVQRQAGLC